MQIEQKIHEAMINDKVLKELSNKLYELHIRTIPYFDRVTNQVQYRVSDDMKDAYNKIEALMQNRIEQIKRFYEHEFSLQGRIRAHEFEKRFNQE